MFTTISDFIIVSHGGFPKSILRVDFCSMLQNAAAEIDEQYSPESLGYIYLMLVNMSLETGTCKQFVDDMVELVSLKRRDWHRNIVG
jgi:hypothetical protein